MTLRSFYIFLGVILFNTVVTAQTFSSKNITANDGLPSNAIRAIYKDSRGYMWIGTDGGLCRYDGKQFKVFNETDGLKHSTIWSIVEDENQNIWLSCYGDGLAKYDGKTFSYYTKTNGLAHNSIRVLHWSKQHHCLIIGTESGLSLFDGKKFKTFQRWDTLHPFQVMSINEAAEKTYITSMESGVFLLDIDKNNINNSSLHLIRKDGGFPATIFNNQYFDFPYHPLLKVHSLTNDSISESSKQFYSPIAWSFAQDSSNNLYFATWSVWMPVGGLYRYSNGKLDSISTLASISSTMLWSVFYDHQYRQLWVGSLDKGLYIVDVSNSSVLLNSDYFKIDNFKPTTIFNDNQNNTWVGAKNCLVKLRPNGTYQTISKTQLWKQSCALEIKHKKNPYQDKGFVNDRVANGFESIGFTQDKEGNIWYVNTWGFFCLDEEMNLKYAFSSGRDGHIGFDNRDRLFLSIRYNTLHIYTDKFNFNQPFILPLKGKNTPRDVGKIISKDNQLWYASLVGLYTSIDTTFTLVNNKSSFSETNIKDIAFDDLGNLVIGANSGKVIIAKPLKDTLQVIETYSAPKNLLGNSVSFVTSYKGYYIAGTNKGINILKDGKLLKVIGKNEGLNDAQFFSSTKDKSNYLYLTSNNGVLRYSLEDLIKVNGVSTDKINITGIKINQVPYADSLLQWGVFSDSVIELNYNQNDIQLTFSQNNSFNADKIFYRYKIVGISDKWSEYDNTGKIDLRGISNGTYIIIIDGKNIGTGETISQKTITIIINPPFWKTIWFILLMLLLVASLIYLYIKIRTNRIRKEEQHKAELTNKLLESRLEAIRSQMNPHFIFNAINSIQNFIIDSDTNRALHYTSEFSKLIRQTLENSREKLITLDKEIEFLQRYVSIQHLRFDSVKTTISVGNNIVASHIQIPPLLIQPMLENAFEHAFDSDSRNNKITINFNIVEHSLVCIIEDNGVGYDTIKTRKHHNSKGLKLIAEKIDLLNQEYHTNRFRFSIVRGTNNGTIVTITMPIMGI